MRALIVIICFLFSSNCLKGQIKRCAAKFQSVNISDEFISPRTDDLVFPLVFHIIEGVNSPEISRQEILSLVEILNSDFTSRDLVSPPGFPDILSTAGIVGFEFKLAEMDPEGNLSEGIVRKSSDISNIGDLLTDDGISPLKSEDEGGSKAWDSENYINIWIADRTISLGATVAENTLSKDEEGIVLSYEAVLNFPKTISHEMGHYFGLLHPWGNRTGCDQEDDGIADTPFQTRPNFKCEILRECEAVVHGGNIMDFSPDNCLLHFTKLQAKYMQNFAAEFKEELVDSEDCFYNNFNFEDPKITWNTSNGTLQMYNTENLELERIMIFDLSGKLIKSFKTKSQDFLNIPLLGIPHGIYLLRIIGESYDSTQKIILGQ